jgi:hypothetical protein
VVHAGLTTQDLQLVDVLTGGRLTQGRLGGAGFWRGHQQHDLATRRVFGRQRFSGRPANAFAVDDGLAPLIKEAPDFRIDVEARRLDLLVADEELARRLAAWKAAPPRFTRGYGRLFSEQTTQADLGCDFRFLERGPPTPDPDIF